MNQKPKTKTTTTIALTALLFAAVAAGSAFAADAEEISSYPSAGKARQATAHTVADGIDIEPRENVRRERKQRRTQDKPESLRVCTVLQAVLGEFFEIDWTCE